MSGETEVSTRSWAPPVDIYETEDAIVLKAELLYLKGERKYEKEVNEQNYHRIERSYGSFARSFSLPNSISAEKVKAEYKDGLLTLTMPKREEAKPKTIKIDVTKS
jgi:HSP20 family protein